MRYINIKEKYNFNMDEEAKGKENGRHEERN